MIAYAAIKSNADAIVTFNLKDFPDYELNQFGVEAIHPDDFIAYQFDLGLPEVISAIKNMRASLKKPPFTPKEFLLSLERNQLPITANILSKHSDQF